MQIEYIVTQTDRKTYVIKSYIGGLYGANYYDKLRIAYSLWGAKREIKKLKKHYAYCEKHDLPKVVWEEET